MALLILPVTIFCLAIAVVVWTVITVLRHGFTLKATDHATGISYTKATRVIMWWLFLCSATFLAAAATNSMKLIGLMILTFLLGGFGSSWYINKTSAWTHEEMQSCLSLRITSVAAVVVGSWLAFVPFFFIILDVDGTDQQYGYIIGGIPFGVWLMYESRRIWRKANSRTAENRQRPQSDSTSPYHPYPLGNGDRRWWITRVVSGIRSR